MSADGEVQKLDFEGRFRVSSNVKFVELEGEAVLLHPGRLAGDRIGTVLRRVAPAVREEIGKRTSS